MVRLIDSVTLFEDLEGCYKMEEKYLELRTPRNEVAFLTLVCVKHPFTKDDTTTIKAINPGIWRKF